MFLFTLHASCFIFNTSFSTTHNTVGWVCHASELPFVWKVFAADDLVYEPTADELQLSEDLSNYWSNFLTMRNPNKGLPVPANFPLSLPRIAF
jgi:carboxylesterase type B